MLDTMKNRRGESLVEAPATYVIESVRFRPHVSTSTKGYSGSKDVSVASVIVLFTIKTLVLKCIAPFRCLTAYFRSNDTLLPRAHLLKMQVLSYRHPDYKMN